VTPNPLTADLRRLHDEQTIRDLGHRFADACNRGDVDGFRALWDDDAVWVIDDPMNVRAEGAEAIAATLAELGAMWDWFVQMPHAPVITVDGDRATSRWTVSEHAANSAERRSYFNYARYDDELARTPGGWRYTSRRYRYIYLDAVPF
jgi:ketosteroid isomerase-like protein